jgi:hypothetical protein
MRKKISGSFTVDLQRDWQAFARPADHLEMLGVVKRGDWDVGAFAREKATGEYVCINGGAVYELDQTHAARALDPAAR